jgi:hypothetical protein
VLINYHLIKKIFFSTDLLKSLPELKQIESFEELSKATLRIEEFITISNDIESLKTEFNNYANECEKLIQKKQELETTEKSINASN